MSMQLTSEARGTRTKSDRKQLRLQGKVPGVVYGEKSGNIAVAVSEKELKHVLTQHRHGIIELAVSEGGTFPVIIHEVQRDTINGQLMHIDFHQINMDEPVRTTVALHFVGEPLGVGTGGMLQTQLHELEVRCMPNLIPSQIEVEISGLDIGESLLAGQLSLPEGLELKTNPEDVVVTVLASRKEAVELEEAAEKAEAEEPAAAQTATS